ncbi:ATP-binding protein [Marinobacterium arenosum]|uniref:ATP-binding protein n=1 Tax=Marinobacterium arenosum TaxID=2862496 RepID=UPI001C942EAE|nr:sensor histidine kinase [Marinobacterium arenosum]MBY4675539.1 sensor histidine kinase [Marinobacterium arenosum]
MKSIQARLNVGFIVLTMLVFLLLWLANGWFLRQTAYDFVGDRLSSDAYALLRAVQVEEPGVWEVLPEMVDPVYQQPMSGHYFQLAVGDQWFYSRSLWDDRISLEGARTVGQDNLYLIRKGRSSWLVLEEQFMKQGRNVHLLVAQDVQRIERGLVRLGWLVATVGLVSLALLLLVQVMVIRSGLRSLVRVRDDIGKLKKGEIRQLPHSDTLEVEPLVTEINYLVQSMELRLQRSRNALGNLAHAAKTPLTVLDRQIEKLKDNAPDCADAMREQSSRLCDLIGRELTRARIAGSALPGQRIFIAEELEKLERTLKTIYRDKALNVRCRIDEGSYFPGERDDLVELLGNLLDNACKWAEGRVRVAVSMGEDHLDLRVEDDGPGIEEEQMARLMNRGERLDESRHGHGLGMSIVCDIIRQYRGRLQLSRSSRLGGLQVDVCLPRRHDVEMPDG